MDRTKILDLIQVNLAEITDDDSLSISEDVQPDEVQGWDSVNHIKLLFALEEQLGVSFDVEQMVLPDNVRSLINMISTVA